MVWKRKFLSPKKHLILGDGIMRLIQIRILVIISVCLSSCFSLALAQSGGDLSVSGATITNDLAIMALDCTANTNGGALTTDADGIVVCSDDNAAANSEMRTPISSIPFTISESGSYYLTQNLKMLSTYSDGIAVLADDVTIDMMGFTLEGATNSKNGINLDTQNNVVIYNGTIINFPWAAIYQNSATPGNHAFVENVRVAENGYTPVYPSAYPAIALSGSDNVVSAVYAVNNTADGIRVGPASVVKDSTSTNNGRDGIALGSSSSALNNVVANNQRWGLVGGWGSAIIGNTVYSNNRNQTTAGGGLRVYRGSQVENNTVYNNYHHGLYVFQSTNVLRNNHVTNTRLVSGDYYCFYFGSSLNVAIGNTATGCSIEFGGAVPPAARFVDNFQW